MVLPSPASCAARHAEVKPISNEEFAKGSQEIEFCMWDRQYPRKALRVLWGQKKAACIENVASEVKVVHGFAWVRWGKMRMAGLVVWRRSRYHDWVRLLDGRLVNVQSAKVKIIYFSLNVGG